MLDQILLKLTLVLKLQLLLDWEPQFEVGHFAALVSSELLELRELEVLLQISIGMWLGNHAGHPGLGEMGYPPRSNHSLFFPVVQLWALSHKVGMNPHSLCDKLLFGSFLQRQVSIPLFDLSLARVRAFNIQP